MNIDNDLQNVVGIHVLGGERLPAMSYALCPNLKKCHLFSIHQRPNVFSQTPGRCPPHITGFRVNSVTLGWVGAPNERAPLRVHDAITVFAAPCLTRTRIADQGLGGFNEHCAGFARAIKLRVSCPGEFKICPTEQRSPCNSGKTNNIVVQTGAGNARPMYEYHAPTRTKYES